MSEMPESMPAPNTVFCFVSEKPGAGRGEKKESVVRRHVTRAYHRRRREKDLREFQEDREVARRREEREVVEFATADENVALAEDRLVRSSVKPSLSYNDNMIPYTCFSTTGPVLMLPCTPGPFFDMASREPHSPAAFFPRQSPWMPNAVVPNIYKVKGTILSLEVVDWISNTPSCFEFRVETIKWIQDRLTDVDLAKTDDTIGAIMTLAMWESYRSKLHPSDLIRHMSGLEKVVNLRGGIDAMVPAQATKLALFDHIIAAMTLQQPRFPRRARPGPFQPTLEPRFHESPLYGFLPFSSIMGGTDTDIQMSSLLEDLRKLTEATISQSPLPPLPSLPYPPFPYNPIQLAVHAASHIYMSALSSPSFFTSPLSLPWLQVLSMNLDLTCEDTFWRVYPGVRFWVLLVGAAAAVVRAERGYFMMHLARVGLSEGQWEVEETFRRWCGLFARWNISDV